MARLRPIDDVPPDQRQALVGARRRAAVLVAAAVSLFLSSGLAVVIGRDAQPEITFTSDRPGVSAQGANGAHGLLPSP